MLTTTPPGLRLSFMYSPMRKIRITKYALKDQSQPYQITYNIMNVIILTNVVLFLIFHPCSSCPSSKSETSESTTPSSENGLDKIPTDPPYGPYEPPTDYTYEPPFETSVSPFLNSTSAHEFTPQNCTSNDTQFNVPFSTAVLCTTLKPPILAQ